jgi:ABC-2 type transport system permease protein
MLSGFIKYKDLLYELVSRDIKIRYRRSILGLLWTLLNPILMMAVMTIVFSNIFRSDIENFPIYFFTGNILFSFITESTTNALNSITGSGNLIRKVYVPKYLFPVSKVFSSVVNLFFSFIAMLCVMVITGVRFHVTMFLVPIVVIYVILFSIGIGMILATLQVFFRDTAHLYSVVTLAWMYLTPIFYPESMLAGRLNVVLTMNPMVHFIRFMRKVTFYNTVPTITENLTCLTISAAFFAIGLIVFYRKQDKFILYI